ncbi:hypothetical protein AB0I30_21080 [Nocardia tengchongensis]|uniref:hypothetical protein n=1 Tax=Nocardia tengchongensis TaxID=2055889 RepID=UPI0033F7105F
MNHEVEVWDSKYRRAEAAAAAGALERTHIRRRWVDARDLMAGVGISVDVDAAPLGELEHSLGLFETLLLTEDGGDLRAEILGHRRVIATRIGQLLLQSEMAEIKDAVESKVADPDVRQQLSALVSEIQRRQDELDAKVRVDADDEAKELRRIEFMERRWRARKSMLDREPAAVLVGAVLLGVLTIALILAMFIHTVVPDVLTSMVLLILGFFFGQTASGKGKPGQ